MNARKRIDNKKNDKIWLRKKRRLLEEKLNIDETINLYKERYSPMDEIV